MSREQTSPPLDVAELRRMVEAGEIDTVVVAFTDMQGRLQGKRLHARFFLDEALTNGVEGCNYQMATDVEMRTVGGYAMTSWEHGYGDMELRPDIGTLRLIPWLPATAMIQCDLGWVGGGELVQSPRQILARQVERATEAGYAVRTATELEFMVFEDTYEQAWDAGYRGLTPSNRYNVDYSVLGTTKVEPLLRDIRNAMAGAGLVVESAKGECNLGQHEIGFRYADALTTADQHAVYKNGAKEIAASHGQSLTFMPKYDDREGSSCHIHMSLCGPGGFPVFDTGDGQTTTFEHFLAGVQDTLAELTLLYAPNINSYKRLQPGTFAPTTVAWGRDNRTCALRVVGHGPSLRVENRLPGGDVNPHIALAAMLASGLRGIELELELAAPVDGNAYVRQLPHVPATLREAREAFAASTIAKEMFGAEVVDHYVHAADVELMAFETAVTDWERVRGFERL